MLKLLLVLDDIQADSLVLIDELELATHPRAQTNLFTYLTKISKEKNLTVIFSTHSVSLIKGTDRGHVLFLQNTGGKVECIQGCYPTFTLGHISSGEEVAPDFVVYVEDDSGKKCLNAMLEVFRKEVGLARAHPTTLVLPLGGFRQILEFLDRAPQMLPQHTKIVAALDKDVEEESLLDYKQRDDHAMLDLFKRLGKQVTYLPWTPEVGLVNLLRYDLNSHEAQLKVHFSDNRVSIPANWAENTTGLTKRPLREACKKAVFELGGALNELLGRPNDRIREELFRYLVYKTHDLKLHDIVGYVGKIAS